MKRLFFIVAGIFILVAAALPASAQAQNCQMCHPDLAQGKSVHAAVSMGCEACHTGVDAAEVPHKFTSGKSRGLSSESPELCFGCHDRGNFSGKATVHMPVAGGMCTGCHSPHASGSDKLLLSDDVCFNCHDASLFGKEFKHQAVQPGMCSSCHNPHQSDNSKLLNAEAPELCYNCHKKENFYGPTIHAPVGVGACPACHAPHSSDNKKLLVADMQDICFNCHDRSVFLSASVHQPVKDGQCLACHKPHAAQNEFLLARKGNFLCRKCHTKVERAPHAITGFSRTGHPLRGGRDPMREGKTFGCLSCHMPHTSEWPSLFRYKADNLFDLCQYCHQM